MNIKVITVAIILALSCVTVVYPREVSGQTRRRPKSQPKRMVKPAPQPEQTEPEKEKAALAVAIQTELDALKKLSPEQQVKLRNTVASLQRITRKVQLAGFPKYFLQEMQEGEGTEKDVNECLAFLPEGMTKKSLAYSWRALLDSWHLDWSAETGIVDDKSLAIVDRYELEAGPAYGLSRDVLQLTIKRLTFLAAVIQTAFNTTP